MSYSVQGLVASPCSALVKNSFGALTMRHYRLPSGSHYQVCNSAPILLTLYPAHFWRAGLLVFEYAQGSALQGVALVQECEL
jgi:hypothetical protein